MLTIRIQWADDQCVTPTGHAARPPDRGGGGYATLRGWVRRWLGCSGLLLLGLGLSVDAMADPRISIKKFTNGQDVSWPGPILPVGSPVHWTYEVTNPGDELLSDVRVVDNMGVAVTCPKTALAPGESMTCTGSGTAVAGQYFNVGTATGTPPIGSPISADDVSFYFGGVPSITIEKFTNGEDVAGPPGPLIPVGSPVQWTYRVTNSGEVDLDPVIVSDDQGVAVSCPKTTLVSGESMTCTGSDTAVSGQYVNMGTAFGLGYLQADIAFDESFYFGVDPSITIKKFTNGEDADTPPGPFIPVGSEVVWTYEVSNLGNTTLTNVVVTDNQGVAVTCPKPALAMGESMTCTASGTAVAGRYGNVGTATGTPPVGSTIRADDPSHYSGVDNPSPSITIETLTNGEEADTPPGPLIPVGSPVQWAYEVTNSGNLDLVNVTVSDDRGAIVSCLKSRLTPGETMTCTASGTAVTGQYDNEGAAIGSFPGGDVVAFDSSHYFGVASSITIETLTNDEEADTPPGPMVTVGSPVQWSYVVTNSGNVVLDNVTVTDDRGVVVSCPKTTLAIGETMTCTASGTAVAGQYRNVGTATGTPPVGSPISANDPSYYNGIAPPTPVPTVGPAALWVMAGLLGGMGILIGFRQRR